MSEHCAKAMRCCIEESGQMTVELACMVPVILCVLILEANFVRFFHTVLIFDEQARTAITSYGVASSGEQTKECANKEIKEFLISSTKDLPIEDIQVNSCENGMKTQYTCSYHYRPIFRVIHFEKTPLGFPDFLLHHVSLCVDRQKAAIFL